MQCIVTLLLITMSAAPGPDQPIAKKSRPAETTAAANTKKKKICQICGDFSLGFNFGAISCESCKAFFRRNAAKQKVRWQ